MIHHHRNRALPERNPHLRGGVNTRKDGEQTICKHGVKEKRPRPDDDKPEKNAPVTQCAVACKHDGNDKTRAACIRHTETGKRGDKQDDRKDAPATLQYAD